MRAEFELRIAELEVEYAGRSAWAKGLAMGPARASLADMERRYGVDLDANSHGQSFLRLFQSRFVPGGLYSFDRVPAEVVEYAELEHVVLTRDFLNAPERYLRALRPP